MMAKNFRPTGTSPHHDLLSRRIGDLKRERAELEEEIRQLRAAAKIWTEVYRQTMSTAAGSKALQAEMR
jgi:hypothetical protein